MRLYVFGLVVAVLGCDPGRETPDPVDASVSEFDLRGLLPDDALLVGVTETPEGKRYILDQRSGLYELHDSSATLVWNTTGLSGIELTDVVALDTARFAATTENDGFLFDIRDHSFASHFCYLPSLPEEPGGAPMSVSQALQLEGIAVKQRTESVAFNPSTGQLFAQPQTFRLDTAAVAGSELFVFGPEGGEPIQVITFAESSFIAGGMIATNDNRLLLGARNGIYEVTLSGGFTLLRELGGSVNITGMARASNNGLLVLDGAAQRLLEIRTAL